MNGKFHDYIKPLVDCIKEIQDEAYQQRVWVEGIGLECSSFDEAINSFFDYYDGLKPELVKEEYNLNPHQIYLIHLLAEKLIEYSSEVNFVESATTVLNDPKWHEIQHFAKEVYTKLVKPADPR